MKLTADEFNAKYPVGTAVRYWPLLPPDKEYPPIETVTRTPAWNLGHGQPVVSIEGRAGGVDLTHVELSDLLFTGTTWTLNRHGQRVDADPDSRDYAGNNESTRDPIFLLQVRQIGHFNPDYLTFDNATPEEGDLLVDVDMFGDDEIAKAKAEDRFEKKNSEHDYDAISVDDDELVKRDWVTHSWRTDSVWLRRAEAEAYAKAKAYNLGELGVGCRVYCVCAEKRLAKVLSVVVNQDVEAYLQSAAFRANYVAYRQGVAKVLEDSNLRANYVARASEDSNAK